MRDDALLEWARVLQGTHAYGTPRAPVEKALAEGRDVVFDIDWQGHRQLREKLPADVVSVFVLPPNLMALRSRLVGRAGDRGEEIERRMRVARDEIRHWVEFDHVVVNEDLADRDRGGARGAALWPVDHLAHDRASRLHFGIEYNTAGPESSGHFGVKSGSRGNGGTKAVTPIARRMNTRFTGPRRLTPSIPRSRTIRTRRRSVLNSRSSPSVIANISILSACRTR